MCEDESNDLNRRLLSEDDIMWQDVWHDFSPSRNDHYEIQKFMKNSRHYPIFGSESHIYPLTSPDLLKKTTRFANPLAKARRPRQQSVQTQIDASSLPDPWVREFRALSEKLCREVDNAINSFRHFPEKNLLQIEHLAEFEDQNGPVQLAEMAHDDDGQQRDFLSYEQTLRSSNKNKDFSNEPKSALESVLRDMIIRVENLEISLCTVREVAMAIRHISCLTEEIVQLEEKKRLQDVNHNLSAEVFEESTSPSASTSLVNTPAEKHRPTSGNLEVKQSGRKMNPRKARGKKSGHSKMVKFTDNEHQLSSGQMMRNGTHQNNQAATNNFQTNRAQLYRNNSAAMGNNQEATHSQQAFNLYDYHRVMNDVLSRPKSTKRSTKKDSLSDAQFDFNDYYTKISDLKKKLPHEILQAKTKPIASTSGSMSSSFDVDWDYDSDDGSYSEKQPFITSTPVTKRQGSKNTDTNRSPNALSRTAEDQKLQTAEDKEIQTAEIKELQTAEDQKLQTAEDQELPTAEDQKLQTAEGQKLQQTDHSADVSRTNEVKELPPRINDPKTTHNSGFAIDDQPGCSGYVPASKIMFGEYLDTTPLSHHQNSSEAGIGKIYRHKKIPRKIFSQQGNQSHKIYSAADNDNDDVEERELPETTQNDDVRGGNRSTDT